MMKTKQVVSVSVPCFSYDLLSVLSLSLSPHFHPFSILDLPLSLFALFLSIFLLLKEVDPEFDGEVSNRVTCGDDSDSDEEIEIELGEADIGEFMATKPWMGAIVCPTAWEGRMPSDEMPSNDLELEFVHGYRAHDARQNLYILPSGEILYSSAALGIVMNLKTRTQRYFTGHTDDIVW